MLVLGIESSCDDTAVALVEDGRVIRASAAGGQEALHAAYGGIVPEVACRAHYEVMMPLVEKVLKQAGVSADAVDAVAVTNRPGLVGSLYVGLSAAKGLSWALKKPLVPVDHIEAHIYAVHFNEQEVHYPYVSVVVSGGHTDIFFTQGATEHTLITRTLDDAAGECFDKVSALLGLGFPGGPAIQNAALGGNPAAIDFPRGSSGPDGTQISFSGLKTAVLNELLHRGFVLEAQRNSGRKMPHVRPPRPRRRDATLTFGVKMPLADIAASFQEAAVDILIRATVAASRRAQCRNIVLCGGVAANKRLRESMQKACDGRHLRFHPAPIALCTDNAAMVAGIGFHALLEGKRATLDVDVLPNKDEKRARREGA